MKKENPVLLNDKNHSIKVNSEESEQTTDKLLDACQKIEKWCTSTEAVILRIILLIVFIIEAIKFLSMISIN